MPIDFQGRTIYAGCGILVLIDCGKAPLTCPQIEPGSPWEKDYIESFNGKFKNELLNRVIFYPLKEAQVLIEEWRQEYNTFRPQSSLNYRPPAPEAWLH